MRRLTSRCLLRTARRAGRLSKFLGEKIRPHIGTTTRADRRIGAEGPVSIDPDLVELGGQRSNLWIGVRVAPLRQDRLRWIDLLAPQLSAYTGHVEHRAAVLVSEVEVRARLTGQRFSILQPLVENDEAVALDSEGQPVAQRGRTAGRRRGDTREDQLERRLAGSLPPPEPILDPTARADRQRQIGRHRTQHGECFHEVRLTGTVGPDHDVERAELEGARLRTERQEAVERELRDQGRQDGRHGRTEVRVEDYQRR